MLREKVNVFLFLKNLIVKQKKVTLTHVLYVPESDSNLWSVPSYTGKCYVVTFKDDICSTKNDDILIADAKVDEDLYCLKIRPMN